jgi:hypothetical protein
VKAARVTIRQADPRAAFAESIWITCCSGRPQISKTSCSISGPTLTTIARIPHGKGERRICPCHDQSQISARLDGSPIVDPYFRPQWLPNFSNIRAHCGIRSGAAKTWNEIMPCLRSWLQCVSRLRSFHCYQVRSKRERHLPFAARFAGNIGPRSNSPDTRCIRDRSSSSKPPSARPQFENDNLAKTNRELIHSWTQARFVGTNPTDEPLTSS